MSDRTSMFWCVIGLVVCCIALFATLSYGNGEQQFYYTPDQIESYTVGSFDQLQIRKIYRRSSTDDSAYISTSDFELNGWNYHMVEMDKEEQDGQIIYTVIFNGTKIR